MTNPCSAPEYSIVHTEQRLGTSANAAALDPIDRLKIRILAYALVTMLLGCAIIAYDERLILMAKHAQSGWQSVLLSLSDVGRGENYLVPTFVICAIAYMSQNTKIPNHLQMWFQLVVAQAAFLFGAVALSGMLVNIFKPLIGRTRPKLVEWYGAVNFVPLSWENSFHSMPSGHACTMGAVTCVLCIWIPKLRLIILLLGFLLASTRYFALAHYFSDVIIGFGLGYIFTLFFAVWLKSRNAGFCMVNGKLKPTSQILRLDQIFR